MVAPEGAVCWVSNEILLLLPETPQQLSSENADVLKSQAISPTDHWKGSSRVDSPVDFWYRRISWRATVTRPVMIKFLDSTCFRSALTSCLCGELLTWCIPTGLFKRSLLYMRRLPNIRFVIQWPSLYSRWIYLQIGGLQSDWWKKKLFDWLDKCGFGADIDISIE